MNPFIIVCCPDGCRATFRNSARARNLWSLVGSLYGLGSIPGYDAKGAGEEDRDRHAFVQRATSAYLLARR